MEGSREGGRRERRLFGMEEIIREVRLGLLKKKKKRKPGQEKLEGTLER